ncbi:helix-turn-helix transcriptional regulator [Acidihalobacter prosperus]|uniref:DNA-binding protein n=1 Tax=Acidihalobacter prosperus TaxID=160660 RepID=A0A1A6C038_9GAMM|nr:hypothetical protein [Acidihalobacter prosperus]OBS07921.1 hypothetical protein Thpro_022171 [Acidihalobacter prosperus]
MLDMGTESTNVDIQALAAAVAGLIEPRVPLRIDLWGPDEVAAYLKVGRRQVAERYAALPGFPAPIRIPPAQTKAATAQTGKPRGLLRWKAVEIIAWAEAHRDKRHG